MFFTFALAGNFFANINIVFKRTATNQGLFWFLMKKYSNELS